MQASKQQRFSFLPTWGVLFVLTYMVFSFCSFLCGVFFFLMDMGFFSVLTYVGCSCCFLYYVGCPFVVFFLRGVSFSLLMPTHFFVLTYVGCGEAGEDVQMSHRDWVMR